MCADRVLIGGLWHETNTFSSVATTLEAFHRYQFHTGKAVIETARGTNTEIGGFVLAADELGLDLIPSIFAGAVPSGMITAAAFDALLSALVAPLYAGLLPDAVFLALHGAMAAEGYADADGEIVKRMRAIVGPNCPIVVTLDYHANISAALFAAADVVIGYDTYPHTDMAERGAEAARAIDTMMRGRARPAKAFRKLPLITAVQKQGSSDEPMRTIMARVAECEARAGVLTATVAPGFPFADASQLGLAVLVYADSQRQADDVADELAAEIWAARTAFRPDLAAVDEAVATAIEAKNAPFILVDVADNVGGGAPGDGTSILAALLRQSAPSAAIVIWDPEAASVAAAIGVGGEFRGAVGGKADATPDDPVTIAGRITFAGDVSYARESSYMTGQLVRLGLVAVVNVGGVRVVLTTERAMPFDAAHLRAVGIVPETTGILVVKSAIAWAAGFGAMARGHAFVDAPGICSSNLSRFAYANRPRPLYPLEQGAEWSRPLREMAS